jgi:hypothetical protein
VIAGALALGSERPGAGRAWDGGPPCLFVRVAGPRAEGDPPSIKSISRGVLPAERRSPAALPTLSSPGLRFFEKGWSYWHTGTMGKADDTMEKRGLTRGSITETMEGGNEGVEETASSGCGKGEGMASEPSMELRAAMEAEQCEAEKKSTACGRGGEARD